jgi:hypothetical protein
MKFLKLKSGRCQKAAGATAGGAVAASGGGAALAAAALMGIASGICANYGCY